MSVTSFQVFLSAPIILSSLTPTYRQAGISRFIVASK